jgi:hypothetical protein
MLQKLCGIESIAYNRALGHKYYVNSLAQIISQVRRKNIPLSRILTIYFLFPLLPFPVVFLWVALL